MSPALQVPESLSLGLTWLIFAPEWRTETLAQSLQALAVQRGRDDQRIALVGSVDRVIVDIAQELFGKRAVFIPDRDSVAASLATPLVGYIGPGVILHDSRSASLLTHLLDDPAIASVACVLVSADRRGKSWHVSVADAGMAADFGSASDVKLSPVAHLLWRNAFPVASPPRDLWMARSKFVKKWLGNRPPQRVAQGVHVCTSLVTASYLSASSDQPPEVRVPPTEGEATLRMRILFG